ncbi:hypothetical protein AMATHDRAFT_50406 [Amanita thiersii Skay4041]|uniref:Uncharacterized protein n=1 Tax=Amanita thiersii Skay4041 TaxID=703135 RepID=A0A2A9NDA8_9AGAR|nr:hypothetical protein AMATHDRAFT_50406 [Amanita thiersii Skay4041]
MWYVSVILSTWLADQHERSYSSVKQLQVTNTGTGPLVMVAEGKTISLPVSTDPVTVPPYWAPYQVSVDTGGGTAGDAVATLTYPDEYTVAFAPTAITAAANLSCAITAVGSG